MAAGTPIIEPDKRSVEKKINKISRIRVSIYPANTNPEITLEGSAHMEGRVLVLTGPGPVKLRVRAEGYVPWNGIVDGSSDEVQIRLTPVVSVHSPMRDRKVSAGRLVHERKKSAKRRGVMTPERRKSRIPAMEAQPDAPMVDDFL